MSIEAIAAVWASTIGDPTRKLVLLAVANEARGIDGRGAYAAMSTYAQHAECSERTVQRHIAVLLAAGWIREGDQSIAEYIPLRYRPIVYDVAMTEEMAKEWRESVIPGRRDKSVGPGAKGGRKAAEMKAAKAAEEVRGDSVAPLTGDTEAPLDDRGDSDAPLRGDTGAPHMSPLDDGAEHPLRGDSRGDSRGDTGVTQAVKPSSYGRNQTQSQNRRTAPRRSSDGGTQGELIDVPARAETQEELINRLGVGAVLAIEKSVGTQLTHRDSAIGVYRKHVKESIKSGRDEEFIAAILAYFVGQRMTKPTNTQWDDAAIEMANTRRVTGRRPPAANRARSTTDDRVDQAQSHKRGPAPAATPPLEITDGME